jgi:hypothetical protein
MREASLSLHLEACPFPSPLPWQPDGRGEGRNVLVLLMKTLTHRGFFRYFPPCMLTFPMALELSLFSFVFLYWLISVYH